MNETVSIYDCFQWHSPLHLRVHCQWRESATYLPLLVFWIFSPLVYINSQKTGLYATYPVQEYFKTIILILSAIFSLFCALFEDLEPTGYIIRIFAILSYVGLAVAVEVHRRRHILIAPAVYISIILTCYLKCTLFIVKATESEWDHKVLFESLLLMAETVLLSNSEKSPVDKKLTPEKYSSWSSKLLFSWMTPLISKGRKGTLDKDDLYLNREDCLSGNLLPDWDIEWKKEQEYQKKENELHKTNIPASIARPYARLKMKDIILLTICRFFSDSMHYINPILLKELIDFVSQQNGSLSYAIALACLMFISAETRSFLLNYQIYGMFRLTINLNSILSNEVLRKTLRLSPKSRAGMTSGEVYNFAAVDVEKLTSCIQFMQNVWSIPFQITIAMTLLWFTIGPAAIPGIVILLLFAPLNYYSSKYVKKVQLKQMKIKDERTKLCAEVLNGIKVIKLYAWEGTFEERINQLRKKEVEYLKFANVAGRLVDIANAAVPFMVAISSFTAFVFIYGSDALTPAIAFVSLAIFNQIRQPIRILGMLANYLVQSMVSNKRIKRFLSLDELEENAIDNDARGHSIVMSNAFLNWDGPSVPPLLKKIDLIVDPGQLIAIVGQVGSGKSSLLNSIMGELHKCSGTIHVDGTLAYVPQQPWIFNKSIRENILYGKLFDKIFYEKIIQACELHHDFKMFESGDLTEVGENGVNLSGGQKARIELARSLYQDCSIYLLDDPLSAVDSHVGRALFEKVLGPTGLLAEKTRILVTHNLQYTKSVDQIFVMYDGSIVQSGKFDELKSSPGLFAELLTDNQKEEEHAKENASVSGPVNVNCNSINDKEGDGPKLIQKEKIQTGKMNMAVYWLYFKSMGLFNTFGFFGFFILHYLFMIFRSIWLSNWSTENVMRLNQNITYENDGIEKLSVYAGFGILEVFMILISFVLLVYGNIRSAINLHKPLMAAILRAPITFFDVTPMGRIINRLAKDMEVIDNLGMNIRQFTQSILHVLMIFFLCSYSIPAFILFAVPLLASYVVIIQFFFPTIRQLRRIESVNRSPLLSIYSETISGATSIRAYNRISSTHTKLEGAVDELTRAKYLTICTNRWCAARLELLGNSVVLSAAILGTLSSRYFGLSPGMVGLSVSYALNITEVLNMAVRMLGELETNIVSVERVKEYHQIEPEAEWEKEKTVSEKWPTRGAISLDNIKLKYRSDLPLVLKGVSANIDPGQKIAIIGRTGSGKSSLTLALFRMIEACEGHILIDGVRIDELGLHQLRRKMAIIPQDPILFSGTLRFNLDPFDQYSDEQLWAALERCQLQEFAASHDEKLNFFISEGGKNMSVGERQLVCLGRALLRGGNIIILDEATAAVDPTTDALIQKVVREEFSHATIIAIAHRLDTIADYDKILVLNYGEVVEFDSPKKLLENSQSHYSQMLEKFRRL